MGHTPNAGANLGQCQIAWHGPNSADNSQGKSHLKGCYKTGLMGMDCRHDRPLKLISIVQSGEKNVYPLPLIDWLLEATKPREAQDGELSGTLALL
ncbi:hypothetical protein DFH28DRAFT_1118776 [Melampsora americana]|nr:hypothetical protein DFH28DRAFT_1118776 [Melampsora americana]